MNLQHNSRAWHAVQNLNINYIHIETPQAQNDDSNDYKQFKSQKVKQAIPALHTRTRRSSHKYINMHACGHTQKQHIS